MRFFIFLSSLCALHSTTVADILFDDAYDVNFFFDPIDPSIVEDPTTTWEIGFEEPDLEAIAISVPEDDPNFIYHDWTEWTDPVDFAATSDADALCVASGEEFQYIDQMRRRRDGGDSCSSTDQTNNLLQPLQLEMPDLWDIFNRPIGEMDREPPRVLPIDGEGGPKCVRPYVHHLCCAGPEGSRAVLVEGIVVYSTMVGCAPGKNTLLIFLIYICC
jgi:hypothetical protein